MLLLELFDGGAYPFEIIREVHGNYEAKFYAGDEKSFHNLITVTAFRDVHGVGIWRIEFRRGVDFTINNGGDEIRIFATVIAIIKDFITKKNPPIIFFSADEDEPSRVKLYNRLIKRLTIGSVYQSVDSSKTHIQSIIDHNTWYKKRYDDVTFYLAK